MEKIKAIFLTTIILSLYFTSVQKSYCEEKISLNKNSNTTLLNEKNKKRIIGTLKLKAIRSKNNNILTAVELIQEKKFASALKILSEELAKDKKNEELIMKIIDFVEIEKKSVIEKIYLVSKAIEKGNFEDAEKLIKELEDIGEFDPSIDRLIKSVEKEKDPLEKINKFNNLVSVEAENHLLNYEIDKAIEKYKIALDIFRVKNIDTISDSNFKNLITRFNKIEEALLTNNFTNLVETITDTSLNKILEAQKNLKNSLSKWQNIESELKNLKSALNNIKSETKNTFEYEAYNSITEKYLYAIQFAYQNNYQNFLNSVVEKLDTNSEAIKNGEEKLIKENDALLTVLIENEKNAFYNLSVNLQNKKLFLRSKRNIEKIVDYLTKKRLTFLKFEEAKLLLYVNKSEADYKSYLTFLDQKSLNQANKAVEESYKNITTAEKLIKNLSSIITPVNDINLQEFNEYKKRILIYDDKIKKEEARLASLIDETKSKIQYVEALMENANKVFNFAINEYRLKRYDSAKNNFLSAKDSYLDILTSSITQIASDRLNAIDRYLEEIDQILFREEIRKAEALLEKAIQFIYTEKFEEAKNVIDEAALLYEKYKENQAIYKENLAIINYYRERVLTAIKLKTSSKLSIDDQSYEEITELMNTAKKYYDSGDYEKARNTISQVLLEKPYYEEAKLFEVKILLKLDPKNFEQIYREYFNEAKAKFDRKLYDQALLAFEQLLKFEKDTKVINGYILECKKQLGLIKPEIKEEDRIYARKLVDEATSSYASGDYLTAYNKANLALTVWSDVPKARNIREAARERLGYEKPKLTRDNEIKYKLAEKAYAEGNYTQAYNLTSEILKTQDFDFVKQLNRQADLKRQQ